MIRAIACAALVFLSGGCGKGDPNAPKHVGGTPSTDKVVGAWKGAGLSPESFGVIAPAPYHAGYCAQGTVQGIEALICEYRDDASLDLARKGIQDQWSKDGVQTAVVVRSQRTLLAITDRAKLDPSGKSISKLVSSFKKL